MNWEIIGYIGAACTTFCFIPQIIKTVKTKKIDDISWIYLGILAFGILMWTVYGFAIRNNVLISANIITLAFVLIIIWTKVYYDKKH